MAQFEQSSQRQTRFLSPQCSRTCGTKQRNWERKESTKKKQKQKKPHDIKLRGDDYTFRAKPIFTVKYTPKCMIENCFRMSFHSNHAVLAPAIWVQIRDAVCGCHNVALCLLWNGTGVLAKHVMSMASPGSAPCSVESILSLLLCTVLMGAAASQCEVMQLQSSVRPIHGPIVSPTLLTEWVGEFSLLFEKKSKKNVFCWILPRRTLVSITWAYLTQVLSLLFIEIVTKKNTRVFGV